MPSRGRGGVGDERSVAWCEGRQERVQGPQAAQAVEVVLHIAVGRGDHHR
jgi:hypothetical protein